MIIFNQYFTSRSMDFGPKKYTFPKEVSTSYPAPTGQPNQVARGSVQYSPVLGQIIQSYTVSAFLGPDWEIGTRGFGLVLD